MPTVTHCVYHYRPLSLRALSDLIVYEANGETRKFQRNTARSLWAVATGSRLDKNVYKPYTESLGDVYRNPYMVRHDETAEDIIDYLLKGGQES